MKKLFTTQDLLYIVFGSVLFSASLNLFIVPLGLYNGGVVGISQLIRTLLVTQFNLSAEFDFAGIINLGLNLPLLFIAYKYLSKRFLAGSLLSIVIQTITFSLVPIPSIPILNDYLSSCIIGGILSGMGSGIVLLRSTSAGGVDILGVLLTLKAKGFSVGKLAMGINFVIYVICAMLFSLPTALYSIIFAVISSLALDRVHLQNIEVSLMIFTSNPEIKKDIINEFKRGVTHWKGIGGYTNQDKEVIVTIVSKYEVERIKKFVQTKDKQAFIIISEGLKVSGGYEKRLL